MKYKGLVPKKHLIFLGPASGYFTIYWFFIIPMAIYLLLGAYMMAQLIREDREIHRNRLRDK